jgi:hypothetical protein
MTRQPVYEADLSPIRAHSHNAVQGTKTGSSPRNPQPYHYNEVLKND